MREGFARKLKFAGCFAGVTSNSLILWRTSAHENCHVVAGIVEVSSSKRSWLSKLHVTLQYLGRSYDVENRFAASRCLDGECAPGFDGFRQAHGPALRESLLHCGESQTADQQSKCAFHEEPPELFVALTRAHY